jgi:hypothetical protein
MYLLGFPLLLIPFAVYNIVVFLLPGLSLTAPLTHVRMISGGEWLMSAGEMILTLALLLLFGEMLKATRIAMRTVIDHALSLLLFLAMLIEFLLVNHAATGTFFLLMIVSFIDVIGGFAVALRSAQRDLMIENATTNIS